jgi:predicted flavoprotein YhiN
MKVIVIGGGPAGMMAAITAKKSNNEVTLLEKNATLGKKAFNNRQR